MLIAYREGERPLTRNVLFKTTETTTVNMVLQDPLINLRLKRMTESAETRSSQS